VCEDDWSIGGMTEIGENPSQWHFVYGASRIDRLAFESLPPP
jgi:hypothetical protein